MIQTKRGFYAYETNDEKAEHYGPFATADEAEAVVAKLGWACVLVVRRDVDEFGTVTNVQSRFYEPGPVVATDMKCVPVSVVAVIPLTEDEMKFFEEYERQMTNGKD